VLGKAAGKADDTVGRGTYTKYPDSLRCSSSKFVDTGRSRREVRDLELELVKQLLLPVNGESSFSSFSLLCFLLLAFRQGVLK